MSRLQAEKAAKQMIMSGYRHHLYEDERHTYNTLFNMEREDFLEVIYSEHSDIAFLNYVDILGPTRLRAMQNLLICFIAGVCRIAIELGVDIELSFALSDYYINHLETLSDEKALIDLEKQILLHYYDLVQNEKMYNYSKPVASAVRYIGRNLYGSCRVSDVAKFVGLEPHYFSALFSKQVGLPPTKYIISRKLEEAMHLLSQLGVTVTEVAESLGFCDTAHFSRCFKASYGIAPSKISHRDLSKFYIESFVNV